jgi:uncharacterized membrane protein YhaH (DUF805 family)
MAKNDRFWWDFALVALLTCDIALTVRFLRDMDRREREWREARDG